MPASSALSRDARTAINNFMFILHKTDSFSSFDKRAGFIGQKGRFCLPKGPLLSPKTCPFTPCRSREPESELSECRTCLHLHYETHKKRFRIGRPSWQQETEPLGAIRLPKVKNESSARPQSCPSRREGQRHCHHKSTSRS